MRLLGWDGREGVADRGVHRFAVVRPVVRIHRVALRPWVRGTAVTTDPLPPRREVRSRTTPPACADQGSQGIPRPRGPSDEVLVGGVRGQAVG